MSRRRSARKAVRWARYANHYRHIPCVRPYGRSGIAVALWAIVWCPSFRVVRRQAKHRYGEGRAS